MVAHLADLQAQREADVAAMKELIDAYESNDDWKEWSEFDSDPLLCAYCEQHSCTGIDCPNVHDP